MREIKVLHKLSNHENIVRLVDIVRSKNYAIYLVFEFLEFDLCKLIKKPNIAFTRAQLKYIFKQILEGLVYMDSQRVIHRDVKSENILVSSQGDIKFADFGLARDFVLDPSYRYT
jgi:CTD kinase subunit alpha